MQMLFRTNYNVKQMICELAKNDFDEHGAITMLKTFSELRSRSERREARGYEFKREFKKLTLFAVAKFLRLLQFITNDFFFFFIRHHALSKIHNASGVRNPPALFSTVSII